MLENNASSVVSCLHTHGAADLSQELYEFALMCADREVLFKAMRSAADDLCGAELKPRQVEILATCPATLQANMLHASLMTSLSKGSGKFVTGACLVLWSVKNRYSVSTLAGASPSQRDRCQAVLLQSFIEKLVVAPHAVFSSTCSALREKFPEVPIAWREVKSIGEVEANAAGFALSSLFDWSALLLFGKVLEDTNFVDEEIVGVAHDLDAFQSKLSSRLRSHCLVEGGR